MGLCCLQVRFSKTRSRFTFNPFSIVNERRVSRAREHNINVYFLSVCHTLKYTQKQGRPPSVFFFLIGSSTIVRMLSRTRAYLIIRAYTSKMAMVFSHTPLRSRTTTCRAACNARYVRYRYLGISARLRVSHHHVYPLLIIITSSIPPYIRNKLHCVSTINPRNVCFVLPPVPFAATVSDYVFDCSVHADVGF